MDGKTIKQTQNRWYKVLQKAAQEEAKEGENVEKSEEDKVAEENDVAMEAEEDKPKKTKKTPKK